MRNIEQTHRYVVLLVVFFSSLIVVFATHYTCTHTHTNNSFDFMCITLVSKWINRTIEYMVSMVHMFIRITCEKCVTSHCFGRLFHLSDFLSHLSINLHLIYATKIECGASHFGCYSSIKLRFAITVIVVVVVVIVIIAMCMLYSMSRHRRSGV